MIFGSNKAKLGVFWLLELSEGKNRVVFPVVNIGIIYQPTFSLDPKISVYKSIDLKHCMWYGFRYAVWEKFANFVRFIT